MQNEAEGPDFPHGQPLDEHLPQMLRLVFPLPGRLELEHRQQERIQALAQHHLAQVPNFFSFRGCVLIR